MKKRWWAVLLALVVLQVGAAKGISEIRKLQNAEQDLMEQYNAVSEENSHLQSQLAEAEKRIASAGKDELTDDSVREEDAGSSGQMNPVAELSLIDEGYAEHIRKTMSSDRDMRVVYVYPVGEDSQQSMKRFFVCDGSYYMECYLADYISGEISNLSGRIPKLYISYRTDERDEDGKRVEAYEACEVMVEDYDGNGELDILLVASLSTEHHNLLDHAGGVLLWLQKDGEFVPINSEYCGNYTRGRDSEISLQIAELEEKFREEQNPEDWSIDRVSTWVREELLAGRAEEIEEAIANPKRQIPYSEWREPLDLHVELRQDKEYRYSVRIPENPYGEGKINQWLKDYYEREEEEEKKFMGIIREDEETMTYQERLDANFYYASWVQPTRADDTVVSLITDGYAYAGGAHGTEFTHSVVFDTRSGEVLQLVDVVANKERFVRFAVDYIESNYGAESVPWGIENVKDALLQEDWCLSDYGFEVFWNGGNGLGTYGCEIPYEMLLGYLKEEYFPISRVTEYGLSYWEYNQTEGKILMDVNADGAVDTLVISAIEGESIKLSVNETVSELYPQFEGKPLYEQKPRIRSVMLEREEDGTSRMNLKVWVWSEEEERTQTRIYVYLFDGENVILETDYEVEEQDE